MNTSCKVKKNKNAFMPIKATEGSAGYDLRTPTDFIIKSRDGCLVNMGLAIEMPTNMYARIESRSGLAANHKIVVGAGIIDNDYRGEIKVLLFNHGKKTRQFKRGQSVAQIVFERYYTPTLVESDSLSSTERDCGGFGSTDSK
ncbi:dUTPase [Cryptophlebia peltastica nucleopolyhedrovirus]|uniref:dUTP diphosphatase n=1 Tax=Cryptophlebia peltastica nucleopolyhedrovirus TaxID=2304025 RepID=A0A346RNV5_9ABAC|nr:dUTPase [Cryptophlebia peltastica nucleopolyhedrovirus]AXS67752.1 dUTPase [Cryptophlebia peltastica nucleopolyhedrovirus]